jgi:hypothetical protein
MSFSMSWLPYALAAGSAAGPAAAAFSALAASSRRLSSTSGFSRTF